MYLSIRLPVHMPWHHKEAIERKGQKNRMQLKNPHSMQMLSMRLSSRKERSGY